MRVKASYRRFHTAHPEKHSEYSARNYAKNGAKYLAKRKQDIKDNPEKWRAYFRARHQKLKAEGKLKPRKRKASPARQSKPKISPTRRDSRPLGETFKATLFENSLYRAIANAIPPGLDDAMHDDVASDVILAVLENGSTLEAIPEQVKTAIRSYRRMFDQFKTVSIDAPIRPGSKQTLGDSLTYQGLPA